VLAALTIQGIPWPLIPGLVGFAIAFVVQFRLKNHIDRDKVLAIQDMAELYPNSVPPQKILTERGQELYQVRDGSNQSMKPTALFAVVP
jgi:hypothetical protein